MILVVISQSISWRMPADAFVIRKSVWEQTHGLDMGYESNSMTGLDFGYRLLRYAGAVVLTLLDLFPDIQYSDTITRNDIYRFYAKFFKIDHSLYMSARLGVSSSGETAFGKRCIGN